SRVPAIEIEVAEPAVGSVRAPGVWPLRSLRRSVSGAMPLRFGRQNLSRPARVSAGVRVAHVNRPVQREGQALEHSPVLPLAIDAIPKDRVRNILLRFPLPVVLAPQGLVFIAAGIDKLEIFAVGHFVLIDGKCG